MEYLRVVYWVPYYFLLYVNEIPHLSDLFSACLFADDTSLLFSANNQEDLSNHCNSGLELFSDWCQSNRLSINVSKTNYVLFSNCIRSDSLDDILLCDRIVECVPSVRFLGVELDENVKFNLHIDKCSRQISKNTGVLRRMAQFVSPGVLRQLYFAFIEPYLNDCVVCFGGAYDSHIKTLEIAQRKCIRVVGNQGVLSHCNPIFYRLKILKFKDLYNLNLGIYMFKHMSDFENNVVITHNYETRNRNAYIPEFQELTLTQRQSIRHQVPNNWNSIPENIRNSPSLFIFKRKYREYLLSSYME